MTVRMLLLCSDGRVCGLLDFIFKKKTLLYFAFGIIWGRGLIVSDSFNTETTF